jgi:hypothetical protein
MLPILRKAEEMRHLCDEAVDEAPPSLLVRCIVPLIYGPRRRRRDARRGEARRIEGRGKIFRVAETRRIERDRNGPTGSRAKRVEARKQEGEIEGVGEIWARDANARLEGDWSCSGGWRCCSALSVLLCQASMSKAASVPASVGSIVSEDGEIQDAEVRVQWRKKARSDISDSVREREKREERAREKTLAMTCGRSIVRPASVSRSETWDGENPG